jgi:cell fate regulator YaaT (PSP1 superfamily)
MGEMEDMDIKDGAETLSGTGEDGWVDLVVRLAEQPAKPATVPEDREAPATATPPDEPDCASAPLLDGFDAAIPWRGMPSLPSAQPLVAGVLQGARDAGAYDPGFPEAPEFSDFGADLEAPLDSNAEEDGISAAAGVLPQAAADDYFEAEEALLERFSALPEAPGLPVFAVELVLGVKFSQYGPVYFFTAAQVEAKDAAPGKMVLVDTEQGVALAEVVTARRLRLPLPKIRTEEGLEVEIKPIRGLAGAADIAAASDNRILASGARMFCRECIRERALDMKLVEVEVLHDRSKIIFYFTAPTRIDFRELVKDLVRNYHTRIELRQIGVRHETQMIGALGNCGMTCCCRRYLRKFAPVTIKMAKEQNLFLNPAKLSGMCGRLLCCLAYEQENYDEFHKRSPKIGKKYKADSGIVKVMRASLFRQSIFVLDEANVENEYQLDEWEALHPVRYDQPAPAGGPVQTGQAGQAGENERRQEQGPAGPRRPAPEERLAESRAGRGDADEDDRLGSEEALGAVSVPDFLDDSAGDFVAEVLAADDESGQYEAFPPDPLDYEAAPAAKPGPGQPADRASDKAAKSIFGLPGSRYAGQGEPDSPGNSSRGRPSGPPGQGAAGGRLNHNHKHGNRHKPSKKGRNPGGGQG